MKRTRLKQYSIYRTSSTLDGYGQRGTTPVDTGYTVLVGLYYRGSTFDKTNPKYENATHIGFTYDTTVAPQDYLYDSSGVQYLVIAFEEDAFNRYNHLILEKLNDWN